MKMLTSEYFKGVRLGREYVSSRTRDTHLSLLTPQQMEQLTGRKKPSLQIAWLEQKGLRENVHYFVNAAGYPQVLDTLLPVKGLSDFELGEVR